MATDTTRQLDYRPPLDAAALLGFFGRRAVPAVEELAGGTYRRSLRLPHGAGIAELSPAERHVWARLLLDDERDVPVATERCRRLLDLDADPAAIDGSLGEDEVLGSLVRGAPGRRVPGAADGGELALRAVLGQQVSLAGAVTLAARLVAAHGERLRRPRGGVTHLFPSPAALAAADPEKLAMPGARRRALLDLAAALASGRLNLGKGADHAEAERRLLALRGVGPWTAAYVAMRALRDRDAFLPTDLGVRHALERLGQDARPAAAARLAERWRPYRAYAVQHLWGSLAATS
ncbi:MAG: AlkA N-terminal domain-containing protein [Thermoleophilaceae bacterium]